MEWILGAEGVVFVVDGGMLDVTGLVGVVFQDGEILSAGFHTVAEARAR
jgi:hypothetical protein